MLAITAARTGGLCMACKQGIRKEMDAAKIHCQQEQQQPDPFREYWVALVHRVHQSPQAPDAPQPFWDLALDRVDAEFYADPGQLGERLRQYAFPYQLVRI